LSPCYFSFWERFNCIEEEGTYKVNERHTSRRTRKQEEKPTEITGTGTVQKGQKKRREGSLK
jgi:hypothetical protein